MQNEKQFDVEKLFPPLKTNKRQALDWTPRACLLITYAFFVLLQLIAENFLRLVQHHQCCFTIEEGDPQLLIIDNEVGRKGMYLLFESFGKCDSLTTRYQLLPAGYPEIGQSYCDPAPVLPEGST